MANAPQSASNFSNQGLETTQNDHRTVIERRKIHDFRSPHPVTLVKTVNFHRECIIVFSGGSQISCCPLRCFFRQSENFNYFPSVDERARESIICVPSAETIALDQGEVTCMDFATLPASDFTLGVIGTTVGTVGVIIFHSGNFLKLVEVSMAALSNGAISAYQSIRDIAIGLDPAGRPEFVAVSTCQTVVVSDISCFLDIEKLLSDPLFCTVFDQSKTSGSSSNIFLPSSPYRAPFQPPRNLFVSSFTQSEIVRLLVPQRHNASFSVGIALLIVLSSGAIRFVERTVIGGPSSQLLESHRFHQNDTTTSGYPSSKVFLDRKNVISNDLSNPTTCFSHVKYKYTLAALELEVSSKASASSSSPLVVINDAALVYNSVTSCMDLVLVGGIPVQQQNSSYSSSVRQFPGVTSTGDDNSCPESISGISSKAPTAVTRVESSFFFPPSSQRDLSSRTVVGTLGAISLGCAPYPSLPASVLPSSPLTAGIPSQSGSLVHLGGTRAWWAISERVVLPHGTLHSLSHQQCKEYNGVNHVCTFSDCITSFCAHTSSWMDKIVLKGAGVVGCGVGLSGVSISSFSSSPAMGGAVFCAAGDLFWSPFRSEYASAAQKLSTTAERSTTDGSFSLPTLVAFGSTGGPAIESMTVVSVPSALTPSVCTTIAPNGTILITCAGSTITLWSL